MKQLESLIIVGSSGVGKTTLVNGLRGIEFAEQLVIPRRYITRPPRLGDDIVENSHISKDEFERKIAAGQIYPHWTRPLDNGRLESYGFESTASDDPRLRVYSANNAFLRSSDPSVIETLRNGLVVVVMSGSDTRANRLGERSPDMSQSERNVRLGDDGLDMLTSGQAVEVIDTTHLQPAEGQLALKRIVGSIVFNNVSNHVQ